jgi:hypothetical protein
MNGTARAFRDFPRGWSPPDTQRRFADIGSYDQTAHTVEAVLSVGAAVARVYGTEVLLIAPGAVDLGRVRNGLCPLIDSHQIAGIDNILGRVTDAWFEAGKLVGRLAFDDSQPGRAAEGMVSRGTVRGISIGYAVTEWEIKDAEGDVVDPDRERLSWDEQYQFAAVKWTLLESSLVSVPADASAMIRSRSLGGSAAIGAEAAAEILGRMRCRSRIARRSLP